jgi:hypothetical protein
LIERNLIQTPTAVIEVQSMNLAPVLLPLANKNLIRPISFIQLVFHKWVSVFSSVQETTYNRFSFGV